MSRQGKYAVRFQASLDERTMQILAEAGRRLSDITGSMYDLSPSAVIRHAVIDLLSEELRVLGDLGTNQACSGWRRDISGSSCVDH